MHPGAPSKGAHNPAADAVPSRSVLLDHYPSEGRPRIEQPPRQLGRSVGTGTGAPAIEVPRKERGPARVLATPSSKLVVDPALPRVAVEQYRRVAATLHEAQTEQGLKS